MDNKLTQDMQEWLKKDSHSEQEIQDGARMVLQLTGQKFFYERLCKMLNRKKAEDAIRYELDKFLRIRLAGKTTREVKRIMTEIIPKVDETLKHKPSKAKNAKRGIRPDHDQLPDEIKALWNENVERFKKLQAARATLAAMKNPQPCDAFEYCQLCVELYTEYRSAMERYDNFELPPVQEERKEEGKNESDQNQTSDEDPESEQNQEDSSSTPSEPSGENGQNESDVNKDVED